VNTPDGSRGIVQIQPKQPVFNRIAMVLIGLELSDYTSHCGRRVPVAPAPSAQPRAHLVATNRISVDRQEVKKNISA
jgi:hypothetical protein